MRAQKGSRYLNVIIHFSLATLVSTAATPLARKAPRQRVMPYRDEAKPKTDLGEVSIMYAEFPTQGRLQCGNKMTTT